MHHLLLIKHYSLPKGPVAWHDCLQVLHLAGTDSTSSLRVLSIDSLRRVHGTVGSRDALELLQVLLGGGAIERVHL